MSALSWWNIYELITTGQLRKLQIFIIITGIVHEILILQDKIKIRSEDVTVQVKKLVVRAREEQGKTWNQISIDYNLPIRTARDIGGFYFILWFLYVSLGLPSQDLLFYVHCCFYKRIDGHAYLLAYLQGFFCTFELGICCR